jgi:predicted methyltransferase
MRRVLAAALIATAAIPATAFADHHETAEAAVDPAIATAVADTRRKPENRARDQYRHPAETLAFFGVKPTDTVVEVFPSGGWYAEILAPMLREKGRYIAATPPGGYSAEATAKLVASDPARFDKVVTTILDPSKPSEISPEGTADFVLTFRNVHNMVMGGDAKAKQAFADFYRALKPGGVLGVVDHRLPETADAEREHKSGYLKTSTVIRLAEGAGFKLASQSEINANPRDTTDHPGGVWSLPPMLRDATDETRPKMLAIGESDRMTLKFVKP